MQIRMPPTQPTVGLKASVATEHDAAAVGIPRRHVDVLERQQDHRQPRDQHERRRGRRRTVAELAEQQPGHIVDRRADVREDDRPREQRSQSAR